MQRQRSGNRRNDWIIFMSSLYNVLAEIGSILQDIIQSCILLSKIFPKSLANEKSFISFLKKCVVFVLGILKTRWEIDEKPLKNKSLRIMFLSISRNTIFLKSLVSNRFVFKLKMELNLKKSLFIFFQIYFSFLV